MFMWSCLTFKYFLVKPQGSKRKTSVDCDSPLLPPSKVARLNSELSDNTTSLNSDLSDNASKTEVSSNKQTSSSGAKTLNNTEETGVADDSVFEASEDIILDSPHTMSLDLSTPDSQMTVSGTSSTVIGHSTADTASHSSSNGVSDVISDIAKVTATDDVKNENVSTIPEIELPSSRDKLTNSNDRMEIDEDTSTNGVGDQTGTKADNTSTVQAQTASSASGTNECRSSHIPAPILHDHLYWSQEPPKPLFKDTPSGDTVPMKDTTLSSEALSGKDDNLETNAPLNSKEECTINQDSVMSDVSKLPDSDDRQDADNSRNILSLGSFDHTYCKVGVVSEGSGEASKDCIESSESQELFSCPEQSQASPSSCSSESNKVASSSSETVNHDSSSDITTSKDTPLVPTVDDHPPTNDTSGNTTDFEALGTDTGSEQQLSSDSSTAVVSETELNLLKQMKQMLDTRQEQLETLSVCDVVELISLSNQFSHRLATFLNTKLSNT